MQSVIKQPQRRLVRFACRFLLTRLRTEGQEGWGKKNLIDVILCVRLVKEMHKNKMT